MLTLLFYLVAGICRSNRPRTREQSHLEQTIPRDYSTQFKRTSLNSRDKSEGSKFGLVYQVSLQKRSVGDSSPGLRGRRDRSRAQSFGLVEEKKPRGERSSSRAFGARFSRLCRENGGFAAKTMAASPPKLRAQIQFRQLRRLE